MDEAAGGISSGIWEATPGKWRFENDHWEYCRILSGTSIVTEDRGEAHTVKAGDSFILRAGFKGTWEVIEHLAAARSARRGKTRTADDRFSRRRMNVLLDLDGTLTDPREGIVRCIRHAFTALGDPCPSDAELERYIGPPLHLSFAALFGSGSPKVAQAIEFYRERFSETGILENKVYPGIPAALKSLKELGATLIVATSKPTTFAERIVVHFGLADDVMAVFGSELDGTRSDKAELIAHVLKRRSILPNEAYMVGDREHDIRGAKANRVSAIGALWGYGSRQELVDAGAIAVCEQPEQLSTILSSNSALFSDASTSPLRAQAGAAKRER